MDFNSLGTIITIVTIAVPILIVVVVGIVLAVVLGKRGANSAPSVFAQMEHAMNAGTSSPQQQAVEQNGRIARALVLDVNQLESIAKGSRGALLLRCSLVLEVRIPGVAPYRVPCEQWFDAHVYYDLANTIVPVRIDPMNPQIVFVDVAAIAQAKQNAANADQEAHARYQAELLGRR